MNQNSQVPTLVESIQVRATARAGIFLALTATDGAQAFAPLTATEALRLAQDITEAVTAYQRHEAEANAHE